MARLDDLASRSAGFFLRRPVVLDVDGLGHRPVGASRPGRPARHAQCANHGYRRRPPFAARPGPAARDDGWPSGLGFRSLPAAAEEATEPHAAEEARRRRRSPPMRSGQGDALDDRDRAGALGPVALLPGRRCHHRRFGRVGRGSGRRRLDSCLRHAQGTGDGRHDRRRFGAHFLPQAGSGTDRHRRLLPDGRGHGAGPARAGRSGLAGR